MTGKNIFKILMPMAIILLLTAASKPDKRTAAAIEKVMKRMSKPSKALKKLAKTKQFTSSSFSKYVKLLANENKKMLRIKHPEKEFNELSKQLADEFIVLTAALKKKKYKDIEKAWKDVQGTCYECHDSYKD